MVQMAVVARFWLCVRSFSLVALVVAIPAAPSISMAQESAQTEAAASDGVEERDADLAEFAGPAAQLPEEERASALDNYLVLWEQRAIPPDANCDSGWRRQVGDGVDGIDSLVLVGGCNDQGAEIFTLVQGPATVRFHWNANVGTGDLLAFEARPAGGGETVRRPAAERTGDWEKVEVALTEDVEYELVWTYVKDGYDDPSAGPGAVALDRVHIKGKDGDSYADVEIRMSEVAEDGSREIQWRTLPGRDYQLFWRLADPVGEWVRGTQAPRRAEGELDGVSHLRGLHENREFKVELVEPPSFVAAPKERALRKLEGARVSLAYEVEGSGERVAPLEWIWTFRSSGDAEPVRLPNRGSSLELGPLAERHEGIYAVVVTNGSGSESAPPVTLEVFQKPVVRNLILLGDGDARVVEIDSAPEDSQGGLRLSEDDSSEVLDVEPGGRFEIGAEIGGSPPVMVRWQQLDPETGEWGQASEQQFIEKDFDTVGPYEADLAADARGSKRYRLEVNSLEWGRAVSPTVEVRPKAPPDLAFLSDGERIDLWQGDLVHLQAVEGDDERRCYQWFANGRPVPRWTDLSSVELGTEVRGTEVEFTEYIVHARDMDATGSGCVGMPTASHAVSVGVSSLAVREVPDLSMRLLPVQAGRFRMGTTSDAPGAGGNEQPIRDVVLTHSFWLQSTEVSGAQWSEVMGPDPGRGPSLDGAMPVSVTYEEAERFVGALNERERTADRLGEGWAYALPTEAQWERAATLAVGDGQSPGEGVSEDIVPVMEAHRAREFRGLLSNVWEWAADWYAGAYDPRDTRNPTGPETGDRRSLRGGGIGIRPEGHLPTARLGARPDTRRPWYGFRVALVRVDPPETLIIGRIEHPQGESFR